MGQDKRRLDKTKIMQVKSKPARTEQAKIRQYKTTQDKAEKEKNLCLSADPIRWPTQRKYKYQQYNRVQDKTRQGNVRQKRKHKITQDETRRSRLDNKTAQDKK
jgi:hypothetical protein